MTCIISVCRRRSASSARPMAIAFSATPPRSLKVSFFLEASSSGGTGGAGGAGVGGVTASGGEGRRGASPPTKVTSAAGRADMVAARSR